MSCPFPALDPQTYVRHRLHTQEREWAETNCYVDVWIEVLHARGLEPIAGLPFTLGIDFEGDQWTFFKYQLEDLYELYALDVQELAIYRPLTAHIEEQLALGRPLLIELDSFYLPDTAGSAYQLEHVKTTVAIAELDMEQQRLGYFHAQGYYHLTGDDFAHVFHLRGEKHPAILPPYCEIVKNAGASPLQGEALLNASLGLLRRQLRRLPEVNPFVKFRVRFEADMQWLSNEPIATFHQYSFATLRQFGSCYELAGTYLKWLQSQGVGGLDGASESVFRLSTGAKTLQFQLARAMARKRAIDFTPVDQMAEHWALAMQQLKDLFTA
ncbi:DUF1839 family protein [Prosthecobacter sp.]|uniref:DUF1839 family protein n=1 Tax=Prosthecobacter sp. TaxID=1965333 RepID=UPI002486F966|nr:DUF1839 family protein [Prosthecobacter sp.]MDI1314059.1 DUF1839 family protein [Prosthecobacter sp.]